MFYASSFLFVSGIVLLGLLALVFLRRPWAHSLLILGIGALGALTAVLSALLMVEGRTEQMTTEASSAFWLSVTMFNWLAYFWRRRWWFGIEVSSPVPERSPEGGMLALFAASVVLTLLIMLITRIASRLASL